MNTRKADFPQKTNPVSDSLTTANRFADGIGKTFIIAYKENTDQLESILKQEGFDCQVMRQQHRPEYKDYSPSYLCLLNHKSVWEIAKTQSKPTLIIEADFVPVIGLGKLPFPFDLDQSDVGVCWIYTCAPQLYSVTPNGYGEGFSVSTVAYIVTPKAAECLRSLEAQKRENPGPKSYSSWDSELDNFLRQQGFKNYIAFRNYGEHGGRPNLEHHQRGLSKVHRADVLYGQLAFTPLYLQDEANSNVKLQFARLKARIKGLGRLLLGKFLRIPVVSRSSYPMKLISFALRRQLTFRI
ncbi:LPS biosynthesis glycosyltransferase [Capilliphycus salinus ALCB114379]|uniref:LPS biosynthesis glycosyltransferase n=1 Tax=Capilliphycus salinus TaxID=2768948 RepID=UPI0039A707E5